MSRSLPSRGFVGISVVVTLVAISSILEMADLVVDSIDFDRQKEVFFILAFPVFVGAITSLTALLIASYTKHESSDSEKGGLALGYLQNFEEIYRGALHSSDSSKRHLYLLEADRFLENACALHDTIRCRHQRNYIERRLHSVFALAAADGLPLNDVQNFNSWTGAIKGVRNDGLQSLRRAQEISA